MLAGTFIGLECKLTNIRNGGTAMNRNWMYVFLAGLIEVVWVTGLKYSTSWWQWAITIAAIAISFDLIIRAAKKLPLGTVYAVFTGLGTGGTVLTEVLIFGEPFNIMKALLIMLLLGGVVGLKLITKEDDTEDTEVVSNKGGRA
jgi:paired small multidrug resistance pump